MSPAQEQNLLLSLSNAMADAVEKAASFTVLVNARPRLPASGVSYAADLVLTCDHVVERNDDITVMLPDGTEVTSQVAGRDAGNDLALLRLSKPLAVVAQPAASDARIGQIVLALGRPSDEGIQASQGVVSAIGGPVRTPRGGLVQRYLRTDAIPYPGFSGGPLIDSEGKVLGINSSGFIPGASLTIPVSVAWEVAKTLLQFGKIRRGYLGVRSQPVEIPAAIQPLFKRSQTRGLILVGVENNAPGAKGGLMVGDIIVSMADKPIEDPDDLLAGLTGDVVGKSLPFQVVRAGNLQTLSVVVGERE
jgi:S1-C subfamily serine protease